MANLKEGGKAPEFKLKSDNGDEVSLEDLKGTTVVLYFYPKDMTPGCTQEACDFQQNLPHLIKKKVALFGVSRDPVQSHLKFREKYGLKFPLLADETAKVCEAYGVWKEKTLYGKKSMGIERTTFVIDPTGKIKKIFPKVKVDGHIKEVLESL